MSTPDIPQYASVVVIDHEGDILLQLRDNDPRIADPDCLSLFAGALEPGETPRQAAHRELLEETTLDVPERALQYLFSYTATIERHGRVACSHVFLVQGIDDRDVVVQEGQGYRKIRTAQDLEHRTFALISKDILAQFFAFCDPRKQRS